MSNLLSNNSTDLFTDLSSKFDSAIKGNSFLNNKYTMVALFMITAVYARNVAPKLPNYVLELLKNPLLKVVFLLLIMASGSKNPALALLIAVAFLFTMDYVINPEKQQSEDTQK